MIKGVGIDSIEVERVKKIVDKGDAFAKKVFTEKFGMPFGDEKEGF